MQLKELLPELEALAPLMRLAVGLGESVLLPLSEPVAPGVTLRVAVPLPLPLPLPPPLPLPGCVGRGEALALALVLAVSKPVPLGKAAALLGECVPVGLLLPEAVREGGGEGDGEGEAVAPGASVD